MTLLEKISFLMKENNLNKRQLAISLNISYSGVDGWFKVGYDNMKLSSFIKLCNFFNVTMDSMAYDDREIAYKTDPDKMFTHDEKLLMEEFSKLDERGRSAVLDTANRESSYLREEKRESSLKKA